MTPTQIIKMPPTDLIVHEQKAIMKQILEQAKPLIGNYASIKTDYVARSFKGEVSQSDTNLGKLTNGLYSSMKPTNIKSNSPSYNPRKPASIYLHEKQSFPYSP
jgi:hypothetical protein